jgi:hypothetical protein
MTKGHGMGITIEIEAKGAGGFDQWVAAVWLAQRDSDDTDEQEEGA